MTSFEDHQLNVRGNTNDTKVIIRSRCNHSGNRCTMLVAIERILVVINQIFGVHNVID